MRCTVMLADCRLVQVGYMKGLVRCKMPPVDCRPGQADCMKGLGHCKTRWLEVSTKAKNTKGPRVRVLVRCKTAARK